MLACFIAGLVLAAAFVSANMAAANGDDAAVEDTDLPYMVLPVADLGEEFSNFQIDPLLSGFNLAEDLDPNQVSSYALAYTEAAGGDSLFGANFAATGTSVTLYTDASAASTAIADGLRQSQGVVEYFGGTFATFDVQDLADEAFGFSLQFGGVAYRATFVVFRTGRLLGFAGIERNDFSDVHEQTTAIAQSLLQRMQGVVKGDVTDLPAVLPPDLSCDGVVDSIDATLVLQLSAALVSSLRCGFLADANGDGQRNAVDATLILQFDAGLISKFADPDVVNRHGKSGRSDLLSVMELPIVTPDTAPPPAMVVDCEASQGGVQSDCTYSSGTDFNVQVYVLPSPADGNLGFA